MPPIATVRQTQSSLNHTVSFSNYVSISAAAILLYDAAVTCPQEVELLWNRKRSAVTFLFAMNRGLSIMSAISILCATPNWTQESGCMGSAIFYAFTELSLFLVWAGFSALRVYAIGGLAWRATAIVFLLALVPFATNLYLSTTYYCLSNGFGLGYSVNADVSPNFSIIMEIITRASVIASDAMVLLVTWRYTYNLRKRSVAANVDAPIATLLLRDGTLFFVIALVLSAAQLGTFVKYTADSGVDISTMMQSFFCIILSRFLLSLRELSVHEINQTTGSAFETLQFTPEIVTPMGADLDVSVGFYSGRYADEDYADSEEMEMDEPNVTAPSVEPTLEILEVPV